MDNVVKACRSGRFIEVEKANAFETSASAEAKWGPILTTRLQWSSVCPASHDSGRDCKNGGARVYCRLRLAVPLPLGLICVIAHWPLEFQYWLFPLFGLIL